MPKVYHIGDKLRPADAVYIGRPGKNQDGPWGNPFTVAEYGRGIALEMYVNYLKQSYKIARDNPDPESNDPMVIFIRSLEQLRDKDLMCFCAPPGGVDHADKPWVCHGQAILAYLAGEL